MCTVAVKLKRIDLAPLLEHHFNVCGAKIQHYSIIPPLLQMLIIREMLQLQTFLQTIEIANSYWFARIHHLHHFFTY